MKEKMFIKIRPWDVNAEIVDKVFDMDVDKDRRFYICPKCGKPIYEHHWTDEDLRPVICPICGFNYNEEEE